MTSLLDDAVRVLRELPEDVQTAAARAILDYGATWDDELLLTAEPIAVTGVKRR